MDISQRIRQAGRGIRQGVAGAGAAIGAKMPPRMLSVRLWLNIFLGVLLLIALSYPLLAWWAHTIDDDPAFTFDAATFKEGESRTVAIMAALIKREVDGHGWIANNPPLTPTGLLLDNMPNFQVGIVQGLARFSFELQDQLGRTRGSSQIDPDLQQAAGLLQYKPDVWVWNPSTSLLPTASSESQYRAAARALLAYNERLAKGEAVLDRRADNLIAALERLAQDLGSASAVIERHVAEDSGFPWNNDVDDIFYRIKGQAYAYYMVLRELRSDFDAVIASRDAGRIYDQMLASFAEAVELEPWVIVNGAPDSQMWPCHLCAQGFYILRARTQLREVANVLLK